MLRKEMYTWFVFFYTRQAKADYYIYQHPPSPNDPFSEPSTLRHLGVLIHAKYPSQCTPPSSA